MTGDRSRHSCDFQPLSAVISRLTYWSCNIVWFLCKTAIYLYINLLLLYFGSFHVHWSANQIIFHMFFYCFIFQTRYLPRHMCLPFLVFSKHRSFDFNLPGLHFLVSVIGPILNDFVHICVAWCCKFALFSIICMLYENSWDHFVCKHA